MNTHDSFIMSDSFFFFFLFLRGLCCHPQSYSIPCPILYHFISIPSELSNSCRANSVHCHVNILICRGHEMTSCHKDISAGTQYLVSISGQCLVVLDHVLISFSKFLAFMHYAHYIDKKTPPTHMHLLC